MKPKITVGKHSGFCFGVKRAYDLACANTKNRADVFILGKLVHNNEVCRVLEKRGVGEIKSLDDIKSGTVIFTAHGVGPELHEKAAAKGLKIVDTTCPKVMKAQRLAKLYADKKYQVIIFGDKKHKEVKSIRAWTKNKAKIIGAFDELKKLKSILNKQHCLISQTTQDTEEFGKIVEYLKKKLKNFVYFNTICESTNDRQNEVRRLAKKNDAVIVIGGSDSANTRMLHKISKKINPKSYLIENSKQLKKSWLNGIKKIVISAGASTPEWVIKEVTSKINSYIRT